MEAGGRLGRRIAGYARGEEGGGRCTRMFGAALGHERTPLRRGIGRYPEEGLLSGRPSWISEGTDIDRHLPRSFHTLKHDDEG